ncbi:MAG: type II toxin-antitoxin system RelE/ParE family toxin [Bryobacteraceae bacterium]
MAILHPPRTFQQLGTKSLVPRTTLEYETRSASVFIIAGVRELMLSSVLEFVAARSLFDLGGGGIKQRIARRGQGKSGGSRTFIAFRAGARAFFVHGFARNEKHNIERDELVALKRLACFRNADRGDIAMRKQYRSPLMESIRETAEGLHAAGAMDKLTLREFDELCLTPVRPLKPKPA